MSLLIVRHEGKEDRFRLKPGVHNLGRGLDCDVRLKDLKSSRRHCRITVDEKGARVVDLGSGNGSYLNGVLLEYEQPLRDGDRIEIGMTQIFFHTRGEDTATRFPETEVATAEEKNAALKATSRIPVTKSQRFLDAASRKGIPPMAIFVGLAVLVLALVVVFAFFLSGPGGLEQDRRVVTGLVAEGKKLETQGDLDGALAKYRAALALCSKHPELGPLAEQIRREVMDIEDRKKEREKARQEWERLKGQLERTLAAEELAVLTDYLHALDDAAKKHRALGAAWVPEMEAALDRVRRRHESLRQRDQDLRFPNAKVRIQQPLADPKTCDFAAVLRAWDAYLAELRRLNRLEPDVEKDVAAEKRKAVQIAVESWETLRKTAERLEDRKAAVEMVKREAPRFAGCSLTNDQGAVTRDLEREIEEFIAARHP